MMTTNIIIQGEVGAYELVVLIDGVESTKSIKHIAANDSIVTMNVYQVFNFPKDTVIQLILKCNHNQAMHVLPDSTWSIALIAGSSNTNTELAAFVPSAYNFSTVQFPTFHYIKIDLDKLTLDLKQTTYQHRGQFIQPEGFLLGENKKFHVEHADLFYVTIILHVSGEARDFAAAIAVSKSPADVEGSSYSISFSKYANMRSSVTISGIFSVLRKQDISFFVSALDKKSFTITEDTFISITNMRYIVSGAGARLGSSPSISSSEWQQLKYTWKTHQNGLYSFGGDFDKTSGAFRASNNGIYAIQAKLHFLLPTRVLLNINNTIHGLLTIDGHIDTSIGFYSVIKNPNQQITMKLNGILNLRSGQQIALFVRSETGSLSDPYQLTEKTSFSVTYIGPKWAVPSFHAVYDQSYPVLTRENIPAGMLNKWSTTASFSSTTFASNKQFDGTAYTSDEDAIYLVSFNIAFENVNCTNIQIRARIYITEPTNGRTGFTGIQDTRDPGSRGKISLSAASAIRLKVGRKIGLVIDTPFALGALIFCSYTLSYHSSFSVAKWSPIKNPVIDEVKYVGTLAMVSNPVTIGVPDWQQLGSNNIKYDPGLITQARYQPGLFYTGEKINRNQADFDIVQPGIFFISGSIFIKSPDLSKLKGTYKAQVQIDNKDNTDSSITVLTNQQTNGFTLSFAGTIIVSMNNRVRVAVTGVGDARYQIGEKSVFSLVKLQPDYKTPGIITDFSTRSLEANNLLKLDMKHWDASRKMGLTIR